MHFISWGSGQNVLYSYIMIFFIAIFGLNVFSVRLPMAIVGCISLIIVYKLLKKYGKKATIIGLTFFAIVPWHIMKSRWGLESNLFPDLVLWGTYFILHGIELNKLKKFYIGIAILAISVYSYGTSYLFLPVYILLILTYLLINKKINIKNAIISLAISGIIALPMIVFVIINTFDLDSIRIGFLTIPRVYENRFQSETAFLSISSMLNNFINNIKIVIEQTDTYLYNSLPFFGTTYVISLPFTVIGLVKSLKEKHIENKILNACFSSAFLLLFILNQANINRINIIFMPLIFYTIIGIYEISKNNNFTLYSILCVYIVLFIMFISSYILIFSEKGDVFEHDLEEPLTYISNIDVEHIYISDTFVQPYIYTLFYTKTFPEEYRQTVKYNQEKVAFETIRSYGKYEFYLPKIEPEKDAAYLVPNDYNDYDTDRFNEVKFKRFKLLMYKKEE